VASSYARQPVLPQLRYEDPAEAIAWLCRVFGFTEQVRLSGPNGEVYISEIVSPGGGMVMIAGPFNERAKARLRTSLADYRDVTEEPWPNLSYSITTIVPDVDAHYEAARAEGAQILVPPQNQPWGLRDYEVLDLEGRLWNFSQHLNDVEPEDWGAKQVSTASD
jgi:uncharacterized glyoxalase superfamily protein PhnB